MKFCTPQSTIQWFVFFYNITERFNDILTSVALAQGSAKAEAMVKVRSGSITFHLSVLQLCN